MDSTKLLETAGKPEGAAGGGGGRGVAPQGHGPDSLHCIRAPHLQITLSYFLPCHVDNVRPPKCLLSELLFLKIDTHSGQIPIMFSSTAL